MISTQPRAPRPASSPIVRALQHGDIPYRGVIALSALTILGLVVGVGVMLWIYSEPTRIAAGWSFVAETEWNPVREVFGAAPFILGTLNTSLVALINVVDLTKVGWILNTRTLRPFAVWPVVALLYFALSKPLALIAARAEERLRPRGAWTHEAQ